MILHAAYPKNYTHLTSPFFNSSIKRRLAMLTKNNNPKFSYWSRILVLPLIAFIVLAFTVKQKAVNSDSQLQSLKTNVSTKTDAQDKSIAIIPGGVDKVINSDIKERIINDTVPGNNILTKQVDSNPLVIIDGKESDKLKELSPGQIESINVLKGESATNKYGTKAKDGVIEITTKNGNLSSGTLQLREKPINEANTTDASSFLRLKGLGTEQPLIIIDGKEANDKLKDLPAEQVESVTVLKGTSATSIYGEKGKDGVIVITTKSGGKPVSMELERGILKTNEAVTIQDNPIEVISVTGQTKKDTVPGDNNKVFEKVENEAEFPGGIKAWFNYLQKNLNANVPVDKGARKGQYTVVVQYIVHTDGSISDVKALTKHGYGMEDEVIRVITKMPKWIPAIQNGHKVAAYRKQPVTFAVSAG
jgi:TonB-dependent SusC/RagA subfamily outer membrane receptor